MSSETTLVELEGKSGAHTSSHDQGFIAPDITMVLLTWVTFFCLLAILQKFAWKPILAALDSREQEIKKAVNDADVIKEEMAQLTATCQKILADAQEQSKIIIAEARKAGIEAARHIENKAKEDAKIIIENATREIKEEKNRVQSELRIESANIAVMLAQKIIEENLDDERNRKLVNRLIKEL